LVRWIRAGFVVALLLVVITMVRFGVDEPRYGVAYYAVVPIVLAAFWLGRGAALAAAGTATTVFLVGEVLYRAQMLSDGRLWLQTINRTTVYFVVALAVTALINRERRLLSRVEQQKQQLGELESIREALTPAVLPQRPGLELATAFVPADGRLAGDFFLVAAAPANSTTIVVGDVVGHGFEAARRASFVRAVLATFAPFSRDPAQLLRLANTALTERIDGRTGFVTAVCVNIAAVDGRLSWACAGHEPPWMLDSGEEVKGGCRSMPLGLMPDDLHLEAGFRTLPRGAGLLLFTDGLIEGRAAHHEPGTTPALFGEERVREVLAAHRDASPEQVARALSTSVTDFSGGALADDVCVITCRLTTVDPPLPTESPPDRLAGPSPAQPDGSIAQGWPPPCGVVDRWRLLGRRRESSRPAPLGERVRPGG
jgi:serine phosphatase RsbU (regulator of sigma subunit)